MKLAPREGWMGRNLVRAGAAAVVLLELGGCAGEHNAVDDMRLLTHSSEDLSPADAKLLAEAKRYAQTRLTGAVAGGALGGGGAAGIAKAMGGGTREMWIAGLAGAVVGGAGGYAAGAYVAEANQQTKAHQDDLNARIAAVKQDVARYETANAAARQMVAERRQEIDKLNQEYAAGQIDAAAYESELADVQVSLDSLNSLIAESEANAQLVGQDLAAAKGEPQQLEALKARHEELITENRLLQAQLDELLAIVDTVPSEVAVPGREQPV